MNPLNRRMFRQPGMSRQPAGILASSPQLANTVANRQPVRMANGGTNTYTAAVQRAVQAGDKRALQELAKPINYGAAARTPDGQNALRLARQAITQSTQISTDAAVDAPVSDAERMAANRSNLGALRGAQGLDQGADLSMSGGITNTAPAIDARSNLAAFRASQGLDQGASTDFQGSGSSSSSTIEAPLSDAERMAGNRSNLAALRASTPAGLKRRSDVAMGLNDDPYLNEDGSERLVRDPSTGNLTSATARNIDASLNARLSDEVVPQTEAEILAQGSSTFGTARPVSTQDPGLAAEAAAALPTTTIDPATQDPGVRAGVIGTEPPKKVKKKKTAVEIAIDLADENESTVDSAEKTVIGATSNENINAAIASALETQQSNASDKEKADATDSILGITAKARKERVKARQALIKELVGEDEAKDMRTDANYNLIMLGLLMASGQSENAITNFAEAAKTTLGSFAKVKGERSQAKRKEDRAIALKALDEVGVEISQEEKRMYDNQVRADSRRHDLNLQDRKDVAALKRLDRQLTSQEVLQIQKFEFKELMNNRDFRQNIALLGIKAENAEGLQQLQNEFNLELQDLKNQGDSAAIKTAKAIMAANPELYPTLADAYAATKATSTSRPTDEQQRYSRLVASGMPPSQAIIFAQTGVTTEMFKQLGVEDAQGTIGGLMNSEGQSPAPASIKISDLPADKQKAITDKYKVGEKVTTKQGIFILSSDGTLVPVR